MNLVKQSLLILSLSTSMLQAEITNFTPIDGLIELTNLAAYNDVKDYVENTIEIYEKRFLISKHNKEEKEIAEKYDIALLEENKNYLVYVLLNKETKERKMVVNSKIKEKYLPSYIYYDSFNLVKDFDRLILKENS